MGYIFGKPLEHQHAQNAAQWVCRRLLGNYSGSTHQFASAEVIASIHVKYLLSDALGLSKWCDLGSICPRTDAAPKATTGSEMV